MFFSEFSYLMDPGSHDLSFQLFERHTEQADWQDIPLQIRSFHSDSLLMSDIIPALDIEQVTGKDGVEDLVLAAEKVVAKRPATTFFLAGDGIMRPKIEQMIEERKLKENFIFNGKFSLKEAAKIIAQARIWTAPYNIKRWPKGRVVNGRYYDSAQFEKYGFYFSPLRIFEYLGCGKPIIASDYPAITKSVNRENGDIIRPGDIEGLAQSILTLLSQDLSATSEKNLKTASKFTWTEVVKSFNLEKYAQEN